MPDPGKRALLLTAATMALAAGLAARAATAEGAPQGLREELSAELSEAAGGALVAAGRPAVTGLTLAEGVPPRAQQAAEAGGPLAEAEGDGKAPPAAAEKRIYLVAAMGDSLTDPRSKGGRYLEYLRDKCPKSRFDSYGVGGNMVNQMRRRFLRDVFGEADSGQGHDSPRRRSAKRPKYTHVMVLGGINDICSDESAHRSNAKIKKDLAAMYAMARARGTTVVALTMPPWAGFTRYYNRRRANSTLEVNAWIKQRHKAGDVDALLDVYPLMSCGEDEFLCEKYGWPDKVHWNAAGHKVVGKALYEQVFADCQ